MKRTPFSSEIKGSLTSSPSITSLSVSQQLPKPEAILLSVGISFFPLVRFHVHFGRMCSPTSDAASTHGYGHSNPTASFLQPTWPPPPPPSAAWCRRMDRSRPDDPPGWGRHRLCHRLAQLTYRAPQTRPWRTAS